MGDRERIIAELWDHIRMVDVEHVRQHPAAVRAIKAGAPLDDVARAMALAAYEATFHTLFVLTSVEDLAELTASGAAYNLHEDLLTGDPTGQEGRDLTE